MKTKIAVLFILTSTITFLTGCAFGGPKAVSLGNGNPRYTYEMSMGPQKLDITASGREYREYLKRRQRIEQAHELRMIQIENMDAERKFMEEKGVAPAPRPGTPATSATNRPTPTAFIYPDQLYQDEQVQPAAARTAYPSQPVFSYTNPSQYSYGGNGYYGGYYGYPNRTVVRTYGIGATVAAGNRGGRGSGGLVFSYRK